MYRTNLWTSYWRSCWLDRDGVELLRSVWCDVMCSLCLCLWVLDSFFLQKRRWQELRIVLLLSSTSDQSVTLTTGVFRRPSRSLPPCKTISVGNGVKSVVKSYRCFIPAKVWKYSLLAWHRFVFLVHNVTGLLKNLCYPPTCTIGVTIILSHDQHCTMCRCASLNTVPLSKKWSASYCAFSPYAQTKRNTIIYLATSELQ